MRGSGRRLLLAASGLVLALTAAVLLRQPTLWALLAGALLALASWGAVTVRARALTTRSRPRDLLQQVLQRLAGPLYYALVVALLWAVVTYLRPQVAWLVVGYISVLALLALRTASGRRR